MLCIAKVKENNNFRCKKKIEYSVKEEIYQAIENEVKNKELSHIIIVFLCSDHVAVINKISHYYFVYHYLYIKW